MAPIFRVQVSVTKVKELGMERKITSAGLRPDDGLMCLTWLPASKCTTRLDMFKLGFNMSKVG